MRRSPLEKEREDADELPWIPILMYHRVVRELPPVDPHHLCIGVQEFEQQMRYFSERGYKSVSLGAWVKSVGSERQRGERCVVITFDDGYADFLENALPVLEKYQLAATLFVISGCIDGTGIRVHGLAPKAGLMSLGDLEAARDTGMIMFGSHGRTHRSLTDMPMEEAREELTGSKKALEELLAVPIQSVCYPYGDNDAQTQEMVRQAGYEVACGLDRREHTRFHLSRIHAAAYPGLGLGWRLRVSGRYKILRQNRMLCTVKRMLVA